ncbi:MAG: hypothetical protein EOM18_17765 [Clostridia bacterium]|nr:hypothetical protein [Clostridia bacterium]
MIWHQNLEIGGKCRNSSASLDTNLMNEKEAEVDYPLSDMGTVKELTFFDVDYDDEKYFFPFDGKVAFFNWETGTFEEIENWKRTFGESELQAYLSASKTLKVQYILDDTLDTTTRSCMLPCLKAAGEVE